MPETPTKPSIEKAAEDLVLASDHLRQARNVCDAAFKLWQAMHGVAKTKAWAAYSLAREVVKVCEGQEARAHDSIMTIKGQGDLFKAPEDGDKAVDAKAEKAPKATRSRKAAAAN